MPHVVVKLWPGKSEQQKARLAKAITEDVTKILQYGEESVSVAMEEIKPQDWVEKVYTPDIQNNPDNLYKKPGYGLKDLTKMKLFTGALISLSLLGAVALQAQAPAGAKSMTIARSGSQQPSKGAAELFTGSVEVEPLFPARDSTRASGGSVTFQPGARSAWHTHPLGQILIVTAGTGRVQQWGKPVEVIRKGDVVWPPAGVKHWHGAAPDSAMTHIAIQEEVNGKVVDWMEKVTDEQYRKR